jgi:hypothetical protein
MHPCASKNPPSWCGKKRRKGGKRKPSRKATAAMLAVANNPTAHGFKRVSEKACINKKTGRLKKGCMRGRGKHRGMIFKRA